jgi:peroxiredoxin
MQCERPSHPTARGHPAAAGWDLPGYQGNDAWVLPIPATFVVGTDGLIKARFVDPDYRQRMAIDELLGTLRNTR